MLPVPRVLWGFVNIPMYDYHKAPHLSTSDNHLDTVTTDTQGGPYNIQAPSHRAMPSAHQPPAVVHCGTFATWLWRGLQVECPVLWPRDGCLHSHRLIKQLTASIYTVSTYTAIQLRQTYPLQLETPGSQPCSLVTVGSYVPYYQEITFSHAGKEIFLTSYPASFYHQGPG